MATTPTSNAVPSESPIDLKFNAGKIDEFVTSFAKQYIDRFGNAHYTIEGLRYIAQQAIANFGWITVKSFQDGATLTLPNEVLYDESTGEYYRWDGDLPKIVPSGSTPETTGGIGSGAWLSIGDASLRADIASTDDALGDALIGVKQPYTGAIGRTQHDKNKETISIGDFGAAGDGETDDTTALLNACTALGDAGGTVFIPNGYKILLSNSITIPSNVCINGPYNFVGSPKNNASYPYDKLGSIIIDSSASITLSGGSGLKGLLIIREGIKFPETDSSSFAGTAVIAGGDDVFVDGCMILGFALAFKSSGFQRPYLRRIYGDNLAGIEINDCLDIARIIDCHMWPFVTVAAGSSASSHRSGAAYKIMGSSDWSQLTNCFSYGYYRSIHIVGSSDTTVTACSADGTQEYDDTMGIVIEGDSPRTKFIGCHVSSQDYGVYLNTTGTYNTTNFVGCTFATNSVWTVWSPQGNGIFVGCAFHNTPTALYNRNQSNFITITQSSFVGITGDYVFDGDVGNTHCIFKDNTYLNVSGKVVSDIYLRPTLISADSVALPTYGETFNVTGTTTISGITGGWSGRQITLVFASALTVVSSIGNTYSMRLSGGVNFGATGLGTLTLVHTGTQWYEVGRSN